MARLVILGDEYKECSSSSGSVVDGDGVEAELTTDNTRKQGLDGGEEVQDGARDEQPRWWPTPKLAEGGRASTTRALTPPATTLHS